MLESPELSVTVSDLGAELQRIRMADGRDLLWDGDPAFWTGRAPILFPIVGRAPGDRIAVHGREAGMRQHGFARRSRFTMEEAAPTSCRHVLIDTEESRAVYPFTFRLAVTHALDGPALKVTAEVTNTSERAMPFGLGFHPAFRWPLPGGEGCSHTIMLENGAEPALALLEDGLLLPKRLASPFRDGRLELDHKLFGNDALIFPSGSGSALRYAAEGSDAPVLWFCFENTPNLGIWSKPGAPFLCIEPWHGMAAEKGAGPEIAARPFSIELRAGATERFGYSIQVEVARAR
jgi:galactose mutarotase-like enzyme